MHIATCDQNLVPIIMVIGMKWYENIAIFISCSRFFISELAIFEKYNIEY